MVVPAHARSLPIRRAVTPNVIEANLSTVQMRQPTPVSFSRKETGAETTAAALTRQRIAAFVPVTIGMTTPMSPAAAIQMMVPQLMEWTAPD
ncbi:hypothetical protein FJD35_26855 [Pseudomonas mandelii]|nr:hypothetical protein FJD35_26855 [Pseudomonas mandelii]